MTPLLGQRLRPDRSFERIYQRHAGDVYRYAYAILRNAADAEDVTQTTFLNAYRAYERGERPRTPHNWLIAIAHNVCRQRFRQSQRRVDEVAFDENVAEAAVVDEDAPSADDIRRALGHLGFNQRAALVMRELEGRSYKEIAEILDVSVSAVETLIFRARRALREQLEGGLTCREAELAISRQLDGALPRGERGKLRAHLRECGDCAGVARRLRAQRSAIRALGIVPLPASLSGLFGGGTASAATAGAATAGAAGAGVATAGIGTGVAMKAAAVVAAGAIAGGAGYEGSKHVPFLADDSAPTRQAAKASAKAEKAAAKLDRPGRRVGIVRRAAGEPPGRRVGQTAAAQKRAARAKANSARKNAQAARKATKAKQARKPHPVRGTTTTPVVGKPPPKPKKVRPVVPVAKGRSGANGK